MAMLPMELRTFPWNSRSGRFSPLKALVFVLLFIPAIWTYYDAVRANSIIPGMDFYIIVALVYWWGVWGLMLLLLTLFMTPARRIFRWNKAIAIRRMLGVGALVYCIAHTVAYFWLRFFDPAFIAVEVSTRLSLIIATLSLVGLLALGLTSFDAAIKWMGAKEWDQLHVATYFFTGLAVFHFVLSPGSAAGLPFLLAGVFFWLMAWRWLDRRRVGDRVSVLLGLTLVSTVFTLALEATWSAVWFDMDPMVLISWNWTFTLGLTPTWQMLLLGTAVTIGAAVNKWFQARQTRRAEA
jgi:sulfoxide reductase heme-binding subunit YedZ